MKFGLIYSPALRVTNLYLSECPVHVLCAGSGSLSGEPGGEAGHP